MKQNAAENIYWLMEYARLRYGDCSDKDKGKGVDYSGKDLVRACFLSHDERALMRVKTPMANVQSPCGTERGQRAAYSESFRNEVFLYRNPINIKRI